MSDNFLYLCADLVRAMDLDPQPGLGQRVVLTSTTTPALGGEYEVEAIGMDGSMTFRAV